MSPVVSVVMPARNAAATVAEAVASIRAQTLRAWELIAVDDGSLDATAAEIVRAAEGDPRVHVRTQAHGGIVAALNAGLARARAPFVARMDADDVAFPARLERQVAFLEAHPEVGLVSCRVAFGGDPVAARGYAVHVDWINSLVDPDEIARSRFIESPVAHPSVLFRRELLERHGGYREEGGPEDYDLWLRWMESGVRFAKVPEILMRWNDPPGRLSRRDARYDDSAFFACKCRHLGRWLRAHVAPGRRLFLWGAGRITRRRFAALGDEGVRFAGYIDPDLRKIGGVVGGIPVIAPEAIPSREQCFVIGGVGVRGARDLHRAMLTARGFREGEDFIFAA